MAFTDSDKKEHISELQRRLYDVSFVNEKIPPIMSDGIYGKETAQAIKAFQLANNLEATGEADSKTWATIMNYCQTLKTPINISVIPKKFILSTDTNKDIIYIIQVMLNRLGDDFKNFPQIKINGIYSEEMKEALAFFSRISDIDCDHFDVSTWNMLAFMFNARKK